MENGIYAARVTNGGVKTICVDEDTVFYAQTSRMFRSRDKARMEDQRQEELARLEQERRDARKRRRFRRMISGCAGWACAGVLVLAGWILGTPAVIAAEILCFGAVCFKAGCYFRKEADA